MQEIFFSETCRFADVILPASPSLEKEGTFTSTERRIQRLYQVLEPLGDSRPDWEIIQDIANRLGADWNYQHPSEIYEEIASLTPMMAGVTYERLEGYKSLQWPVAADGTDQPLLYTKQFKFPGRQGQVLSGCHGSEPTDQPDAEFDLHLNNGRLLEHFHEGNMTYRTEGIREKTPCTFVEVSPELAEERGIQTGSWVQLDLALRQGARAGTGHRSRVQGKELYMPMNSVEEPVNRLTSSYTDKVTHTPAYKETSVQHEAAWRRRRDPLPRTQLPLRPSHAAKWRGSRAQVEARGLSRTRAMNWCRSRRMTRIQPQGECTMAQPIPLELPPRDPREELIASALKKRPSEHAEALLDSYELLQQLHEHRRVCICCAARWARATS